MAATTTPLIRSTAAAASSSAGRTTYEDFRAVLDGPIRLPVPADDALAILQSSSNNNNSGCANSSSSSALHDFFFQHGQPFFDPFSDVNNIPFLTSYLYLAVNELSGNLAFFTVALAPNKEYSLTNQTFGRQGQYTQDIIEQYHNLTRFWNVPLDKFPIFITGDHSEALKDNMETAVLGWLLIQGEDVSLYSDPEIVYVADEARTAIVTDLDGGYSNPVLSLDAFFLPFYDKSTKFDDKSIIVLGDGMLDFIEFLGGGKFDVDVVFSHEFSHFLQFMTDVEAHGLDAYFAAQGNRTSADSRRDEMEADAMAAYAMAQKHGLDLDIQHLVELSTLIYHFGDCNATDPDHHGTPAQRECAIRWGADTGVDMGGNPLTPQEFRNRFSANFNDILSLKPSACSLTEGDSQDEASTSTLPPNASVPPQFQFGSPSAARIWTSYYAVLAVLAGSMFL